MDPNGRDIPEVNNDSPDWWDKLAIELYAAEGKANEDS
jgi:hypothetical protein